jgi:hypothetical protein
MKRQYQAKNFQVGALRLIEAMNTIVEDYVAQGYRLTVRQLYYQLVARDVIANTVQEYKRIAGIINDAKLAGLMDWDAMEDRTREFIARTRWESGAAILDAVSKQYHEDMWADQDSRVFVVVEKEALSGVLEPTCKGLDVPLLAARGYPSGSVLWEFVEEQIVPAVNAGQSIVILHLGDHDPSGIDMSRDLESRIEVFSDAIDFSAITIERIALNMDQVTAQKPPENPAKTTDSRFQSYQKKFGSSSWELDALKPDYLAALVTRYTRQHIDAKKWKESLARVEAVKTKLVEMAEQFRE